MSATAKVIGYCDALREVKLFAPGTHEAVSAPADDLFAIIRKSPGDSQDRWLYFAQSQEQAPELCLHRFCYVVLDTGEQVLAMIRPGYRNGRFNLSTNSLLELLKIDASVAAANPILFIEPR
ncbi:MAG: hypothetical protein EB114_10925 [Betaproteobacteria bacterium]|nr:hypothetical protein [Betaproteobacteria bacterium]NCA25042.1 hypothetical protein [Betaproteobacteria bacterium]NDF74682.1 hypothetical protein [Betaproteobacteria bacterium]